MKKIMMLLAVLGWRASSRRRRSRVRPRISSNSGITSRRNSRTVKFDDYANGLYALPGFEDYRAQWDAYNEFPPYELGLAEAKRPGTRRFKNGKTFASCFKNGGKKIAQSYPLLGRQDPEGTHRRDGPHGLRQE